MFSNEVIEAIKDPDVLIRFRALSHAAVLEWIKRDDLKVHSENDVDYLLNKWIEKNNPSAEARDVLMEIRVINLGPWFSFDLTHPGMMIAFVRISVSGIHGQR